MNSLAYDFVQVLLISHGHCTNTTDGQQVDNENFLRKKRPSRFFLPFLKIGRDGNDKS